MSDLYSLLQKIQKRPALYIGKHSVFSLQAFLDGYYVARRDLNVPLTAQEQEFQEFLVWMRQQFQVETGELWASILLAAASGDERGAVEKFFSLLEEFLAQKHKRATGDRLAPSSV
jgi:hypothetical protein